MCHNIRPNKRRLRKK